MTGPGRRLCEHCGTPFRPKNRFQRFCRPTHTRAARQLRRRAERAERARERAAETHRRLADFGQLSLPDPDLAGPLREDA